MNKPLVKSLSVMTLLSGVLILGFQNCSQVDFAESTPFESTDALGGDNPKGDGSDYSNGSDPDYPGQGLPPDHPDYIPPYGPENPGDGGGDPGGGNENPGDSGSNPGGGNENPGGTDPGGGGKDPEHMPGSDVSFSGCKTYVELKGDNVTVPGRTAEGICYYIRLMSAVKAHTSGTLYQNQLLATDVIAAPHSRPNGDKRPYVLGDKQIFNIRLLDSQYASLGKRKVALSSSFQNPNKDMYIDNFFLFEQTLSSGKLNLWAYGTADAEPAGGRITVSGQPVVNFFDFADGGTAVVSALDITGSMPLNQDMSLRFRALDCGSAAKGSDVFLVFH